MAVSVQSSHTLLLTPPSSPAYNKWHETELERWLADHDIPHSTPTDRKDLHNLVQKNWKEHVVTPYNSWDTGKLASYLESKGIKAARETEQDKNWLLSQVKSAWYETDETAQTAYVNVKDWILDSWTDSQLKSFCDYHNIPGMCSVFVLYPDFKLTISPPTSQSRFGSSPGSQKL